MPKGTRSVMPLGMAAGSVPGRSPYLPPAQTYTYPDG